MVNVIFEFEGGNLNPVLDSVAAGSQNLFVPKEISKTVIEYIFREISRLSKEKEARVILAATRNGETRLFQVGEVIYAEAVGNLVNICTGEDEFEFYGTLCKVEEIISGLGFVRIHGSYIISLRHIKSLKSRCVIMEGGKEINIGRKYLDRFREAVSELKVVNL